MFIIITLVLLVSAACSQVTDTKDASGVIVPARSGSDAYQSGQTVFETQCATCHGKNGEGQFPDAPMEPDITGRYGAPPHNDNGHTWHHDDDLLIQIVKKGGMGDPVHFYVMPAFETILSDREIETVLSYIKTMWTSDQQKMQREGTLAVRSQ